MTALTLYAYSWVVGDTDTVHYRPFPVSDDERRLGMVPITEITVEVPDIDPVLLAAAKRRGRLQYEAAQRIKEQENVA